MNARTLALGVAIALLAGGAGWWLRGTGPSETQPAEAVADGPCPGGAAPLYWKAPMDPTYVRDAPGKSPMGMDLVPECPGAAGAAPEGAVVIDSATVQNIGVRTAPVVRRDLARRVRAVGRIAVDERRVAHVHTKVQGWVENLRVDFVGQAVERGEPLLEIYSPELVATQEELLLAARYRDATAGSPFEDVSGGGRSLFEAARRRLALWDVPERDVERLLRTGEVRRTLTLYAPVSGFVTQLGVRNGMEVQPNDNLYTIADLSVVWVLADVYEYELPWIEVGQTADVELAYLPGETLRGEIVWIAPFVDPKTRTAEVRLELDNAQGRLKPEMYGSVVVAGQPRPGVLAIPSEAVIRSGRRSLALVALGGGRFEPRDVVTGLESGDGEVEVRSGLAEGDRVVVSSQFLIDSESKLQEAVRKLLEGDAGGPAPGADAEPSGSMDPSQPMQHDKGSAEPMDPSEPMQHDMGGEAPMDHSEPMHHDMGDEAPAADDPMDHSAHGPGAPAAE